MTRQAFGALGLTLLLLGPVGERPLPAPPESIAAKLERVGRPYDQPLAAWSFARAKRMGAASASRTPRLYRRAERHLARMKPSGGGRPAAGKESGLGRWEALGPGNVGGRTRALVIHPRRSRTMYAAGVSGGVWKTTDGGQRWRPVGDGLANLAVNSLAMDPADPAVLYAGTGEGYFREVVRETRLPLRGGGIFKSEDGGASWRLLPKTRGRKFHWVNDLWVSPRDPSHVYAATRKGVFRTRDGGEKWRRVLRPKKTQGGCLDLAARSATDGDFLFASCGTLTRGAVYRNVAAEGDGRWEVVLEENGQGRTSVAVAPSDPTVVYALASSTVPGPEDNFLQALHAVYRSDESGEAGSWRTTVTNADPRKINTLILSNPIIASLVECGFEGPNRYFAMGWYVNVIAVDPTDPDRVWAGGVDLFRSDDGGRSWDPATYWWAPSSLPSGVHADQHGLVFHPTKPTTLYALNDGGIYRTDNADAAIATDDRAVCRVESPSVVWRELNNNYQVTQFYHGTVFPDGVNYLGGTQDNGTNVGGVLFGDGIDRWQEILGGDGGYSAVDPSDTGTIYATTQNGRIYKSSSLGLSFDETTAGITDLVSNNTDDFRAVGDNFLFIAPLTLDPNDSARLWSGGIRLWRSDDGADFWSPASALLAGRASAVAVAPGDADTVLVGTEEGTIHRSASATTAGGDSQWPGVRPRAGFVSSLVFDPTTPRRVYATYAGFGGAHVWRSEDGGVDWEAIDGRGRDSVPNVPVHALAVDPADGSLYLGTDLGVLASDDGGVTWAVENTGFARVVTESLTIAEREDGTRYLYAFTHGRGAWRVELD